jgi:C-methyltransferase./Macrocin-O-methyltransferase (TylF).
VNHLYETAIEHLRKAKKVILYGASLAALGVLKEYSLPIAYLVDDTPGRAGRRLPNGIAVHTSDRLAQENKDSVFIVISAWTQNAILRISQYLDGMGFRLGRDFVDCSILHYESLSAKLWSHLGIVPDLESFCTCRSWCLNCHATSLSSIAGTWLFTRLVYHLDGRIEGDVAECGAYQGGNAFVSLMLSPELRRRRYQLFDSFEGFPDLTIADPTGRRNEFRDGSFQAVQSRLADFQNVKIHKGFFEEVFPRQPEAKYALVYIDCDLYESTLDCLDYFYPRLRKGGMLFLHDFWLPGEEESEALGLDLYRGVQKACHDFLGANKCAQVLALPETTHGLLVRD